MILPPEAHPPVQALAPHVTRPTYQRFSTPPVGAVLTTGRRAVANLLRTPRHLAPGHPADDPRVPSRAPWPGVGLGCARTRFVLDHVVTACGNRRHRGAARSPHPSTARRYGHTWVVPAVLVTFPLAARRWARPVRVDLYRTPAVRTAGGGRHRTPARPMGRLLRPVLLRCPGRTFALAGDSGFGTHEVARFCRRHRARLGPVGQCHPDLDLFAPPPAVPRPRPPAGEGRGGAEAPGGGRDGPPDPADGDAGRGGGLAGEGDGHVLGRDVCGTAVVVERGGSATGR